MTIKEIFANIKCDAKRYPNWRLHPGFWVTASYRIRRGRKIGNKLCKLLLPLDLLLGILRYFISDTRLPSNIHIGPGLYLPHPNGVIISSLSTIGDNVAIFQQVTVGEWHGKAPTLENNCSLFAGAKVFGGISIGAFSKVGANCVINKNLDKNSISSQHSPSIWTKKG